MRRTKSHKLHPSAQAIASALSQYNVPDDEPIRYDGGGPEESLWEGLPILPVQESWCIVKNYTFFYPEDVDLTTLWSQYKDAFGGTVPSIANQQGGGMTFASGNQPLMSLNFVYEDYPIFEFIPGKTTWFEMDVRNDIGESGRTGMLTFGFGSNIQYDPLSITPVYPTDGFFIDQRGNLSTFKDGAENFDSSWATIDEYSLDFTNNEDHKVGFRVEPSESDPNKFDIHIFTDGEFSGSYFEKEIPQEISGLLIGTTAHENTITVESAIVIQEKDTD